MLYVYFQESNRPLEKIFRDSMMNEPILKKDDSRYVVYPVCYSDVYNYYKSAVACFWTEEEVNLSGDLNDWYNLTKDERWFLIHIIAFFAGADGIVNENICMRFYNEVQIPEARLFYGFQSAMEGVHSEVYSKIIDTYVADREEKNTVLNAIQYFDCVRKKANWCELYMHSTASFATRLVAFAVVEGVFFSGAFCAIFWCKKRGILSGLCFSNELISRDEALHCEFAVLLYSKLHNRLTREECHKIIRDAVEIELDFICESLPCRLIGMNAELMGEYVRFVADRLAVQLGYDKIYGAKQPFAFMESISIESKSNFFERRVSEYALATKTEFDEGVFDMECPTASGIA